MKKLKTLQKGSASSVVIVILAIIIVVGGIFFFSQRKQSIQESNNIPSESSLPTQDTTPQISPKQGVKSATPSTYTQEELGKICGENNSKIASLKALNYLFMAYLNDHPSYPVSLNDIDNYGKKVTGYSGGEYLYSFSPAVNPIHYHIGIKINVLPECGSVPVQNLKSDSDFDSKTAGYKNGFVGTDPIYDLKDTNN